MNKVERIIRLCEVVNIYINHCKYEKKLDHKTITAYKADLNQFIQTPEMEEFINTLSKDSIKKYIISISHYKPKTIKRKLASLKALLKFWEIESENFINPINKIQLKIREPKRLPVVMSYKEVYKIIESFYDDWVQTQTRHSYIASLRDLIIVELLFSTGMRISEVCNLNFANCSIENREIHIIGKGNKERILSIYNDDIITLLSLWFRIHNKSEHHSPLFINRQNKRITPQSIRKALNSHLLRLNIHKHITPHCFRHTFATLLLEANVDTRYIQQMLGHSSITTTQLYTHVNLCRINEILSTKHPRQNMRFLDFDQGIR